jgi:hypothetical protein
MEAMMYIAIGLGSINSAILLVLIYLYARIALRTRASYSVGLVIFGSLLLVHNLLTVFAYSTMSPLFGAEALPFLSAMGAAELGGLLVLLRLTA